MGTAVQDHEPRTIGMVQGHAERDVGAAVVPDDGEVSCPRRTSAP